MGCCVAAAAAGEADGNLTRPPDVYGVVTPEWVAQQLGPAARVGGVTVEQIGSQGIDGRERNDGGGNSGSRIVRLRLREVSGADEALGGAESLVLKWAAFKHVPAIPFPMRVAHVVLFGLKPSNLFRVEHYFFSHAAEQIASRGVGIPKVHLSALKDAGDPGACCRLFCDCRAPLVHTLLMQDCAGYVTGGAPFAATDERRAAAALRNVARLHRATWGRQSTWAADLDNIVGGGGLATAPIALFGLRYGAAAKKRGFARTSAPRQVAAAWGEQNDPRGDPGLEAVRRIATDPGFEPAFAWLQQQWRELLPRLGCTEPQCMVHGDFHHWNNLFGPKGDDDIVLIDWQYFGLGRPAYEVAHFLVTSVASGDGSADERLLRQYHEALTGPDGAGPAPDYPYEEWERDVRLAIVDAAVTMCLSYGTRNFGVKYTPSVYRRAAADDKQREIAEGGMILTSRCWERLVLLHRSRPGCFAESAPAAAGDESAPLLT
eukprot:TRINITY_DN31162_c0_g1_i1.p1 TRINITY_DN31162_c0_g1~~TRINITY_DN31162_c0_g1_i1.p1  ORF type:complete len:489 (+),score=135.10 TRINITY_DN31162_c0_g1_i1:69-1535(+)